MADDDEVLRCIHCNRPSTLPMLFGPFICETCMNTYSDTGVWPTP